MIFKKFFKKSAKTLPLFEENPLESSDNLNPNLKNNQIRNSYKKTTNQFENDNDLYLERRSLEIPTSNYITEEKKEVKNKFFRINYNLLFNMQDLLIKIIRSIWFVLIKYSKITQSRLKILFLFLKENGKILVVSNLALIITLNITAYNMGKSPLQSKIPKLNNEINKISLANNFKNQYEKLNDVFTTQVKATYLSEVSTPESYFQVSSWIPYWSLSTGLDNALMNKSSSRDISLFLYNITSSGTLEKKSTSVAEDLIVNRIHLSGEKVYMTITEDAGSAEFLNILENQFKRQKLINDISTFSKIYDGVDLDFEALQFNGTDIEKDKLRVLYPEFVKELKNRLLIDNKLVSVTVGARTSVTDPNWNMMDYQALALVSDQIKVMAYDYHNSVGNQGPVTSYKWIVDIVEYMLKSVKSDKITIGLPTYGYLYGDNATKQALTGTQIRNIISKYQYLVKRDVESDTPVLKYSENNINYSLYYQDNIFYTNTLQYLKSKNISQIALWSVGTEDPQIWSLFS